MCSKEIRVYKKGGFLNGVTLQKGATVTTEYKWKITEIILNQPYKPIKMKKSLLIAIIALTSCTKNVADYNIRDINAGKLIGNWAYDNYFDDDNKEGIEISKVKALQDDHIDFYPGERIDNIAAGTGVISQGNALYWPGKAKDIPFTWRMDKDQLNTVIIEVWDNGKLIGGNIANIDGSNMKLAIISSFKIVVKDGKQVKRFYSTSYYCHQLPW
jgi:hypothetical protein